MNKEEWEEAYKNLNEAYRELSIQERDYKNGSNKKIREKAGKEMDYVKHRLTYLFKKYPEVYIMATGGEEASETHRIYIADELFNKRYIIGDIGNLLVSMDTKIKSFDT